MTNLDTRDGVDDGAPTRVPVRRDTHDILIAIQMTNEEILAELRHIRNALRNPSQGEPEA